MVPNRVRNQSSGVTLATALMFASCGEHRPSPDASAIVAQEAAVRAQMRSMPRDALSNFVRERSLEALQIISASTSLSPFIDNLFAGDKPRVDIQLVGSASKQAAAYGLAGFDGDAFTITAETRKTGQPSSYTHTVYLEDSCFTSRGRLIVVLSHELLHMQRRENGLPMTSLRDEEIAVFQNGIDLAEELVRDNKVESTIAQEIRVALATDRSTLARWLRAPR